MAFGVPVVAKSIEALVEVGADVPVWVDPRADTEKIAHVLTRVLADPGLRQERSKAGAQRAAEFSVERTAELTADSLRAAVQASREPARAERPVESLNFEGSVR